MKKTIAIVLLLLVLSAVGGSIWWYNEEAHKHEKHILCLSGNIEITEVELSFKVAGQVKERLVSEGEMVEEGQVVALLDDVDLALEVAMRKAEVVAARAGLEESENGYLPEEIGQAKALVEQTQASLAQAKADYNRQNQLKEKNAISSREFENFRTAYEIAEGKSTEAKERYELLQKGTRKEKVEQIRARLNQAMQILAIAETKQSYATLRSPISGFVLSQNIESGEYVMPGTPIITVGNLEKTWLRAYVNEPDLGLVKLGQRAHIRTDSYPNKTYLGSVSFISSEAEFTPKNIQTNQERVKLVYRLKIDIPNPNMELKAGMPADAVIPLE